MFTDYFFTSVKLLVDLEAIDTHGCGTIRSNRVGISKCLANKKNSPNSL